MNGTRIDKLIADMCPNGVDFRELRSLLHKTSNIHWKDVGTTSFKYVDLASVHRITHAIRDSEVINSETAPSRAQRIIRKDDVLFGTTRPMLNRYCMVPEEYDGHICSTGYCVLRVKRDKLLPGFIYHLLGSARFRGFLEANEQGAGYPAISNRLLTKFRIPVPPVEVQREIVAVLDRFTALEAELEARRRQYQYYRDTVLTFDDASGTRVSKQASIRWTTLGDICEAVSSGGTPLSTRRDYYGGDVPWLRTGEVRYLDIHDTENRITEKGLAESAAKWIPKNCVIVAISGATAARVAINKIPLTTNQHCCNLQVDPGLANYRYVFHWLSREYEKLKALGRGARADLNGGIIKNYPIPVPPLEEQERIVAILDKFDALVHDLSSGLPAEIAARRKQYEHYRDRLLTFKECA